MGEHSVKGEVMWGDMFSKIIVDGHEDILAYFNILLNISACRKASSCARVGLGGTLDMRKSFFILAGIGTGCPEKWWNHRPQGTQKTFGCVTWGHDSWWTQCCWIKLDLMILGQLKMSPNSYTLLCCACVGIGCLEPQNHQGWKTPQSAATIMSAHVWDGRKWSPTLCSKHEETDSCKYEKEMLL